MLILVSDVHTNWVYCGCMKNKTALSETLFVFTTVNTNSSMLILDQNFIILCKGNGKKLKQIGHDFSLLQIGVSS